jgi:AraC family transcriptional regulator, positive regulator of tynA and feaB
MDTITRDTLSTDDVAPAIRLRRWNDFGSETLVNMTVDPHDRAAFRAQITRMAVGNLGVAGRAGGWATGGSAYLFVMQIQGRTRGVQCGREAMLQPGDMVLRDCATSWVLDTRELMRNFIVKIPEADLVKAIGDPEPLVGVPIRSAQGNALLASSILRSVHDSMVSDPAREWDDSISDIVLGAIKLAYGPGDKVGRPMPAGGSVQVQQVCRYIDAHLSDSTLSIENISLHLGICTRSLQRLFVQLGKSPRQYLVDRRLTLAASRLRLRPAQSSQSITDIAFGVGFNDLSYFSRVFTSKYGVSPRDYRRAGGDNQR